MAAGSGSSTIPHAAPSVIEMAWGSCTDVGRVRKVNEDAVLSVPPVFLVADGMGGYSAGDVASATVVQEFAAASGDESVTPEWVLGCFTRADQRIRGGVGGGTTVAGAAVVRQDDEPYWLVFNIGDSRVYHCADGQVNQVSVDHSVVQELVDAGEVAPDRARFHPQRHIITRAVGAPEIVQPDFWLIPVARGERLMMCSDGLTSEVADGRICEIVAQTPDPQQAAESLVAVANGAGGRDNISAVVVDVISTGAFDTELPVDSRTRPRGVPRDAHAQDCENTVPRSNATNLPDAGGSE